MRRNRIFAVVIDGLLAAGPITAACAAPPAAAPARYELGIDISSVALPLTTFARFSRASRRGNATP